MVVTRAHSYPSLPELFCRVPPKPKSKTKKTAMPETQSDAPKEQPPMVKVKLRKYIDEDPCLWFTLADQSFAQFKVTEDAEKMAYVLRYLPNQIVLSVSDIINSQLSDKYPTLRERVCNAFGLSAEAKIDQVLSNREFSGKPSQILMDMRRLVGDITHSAEPILRRIWLSKLPPSIRRLLPLVSTENLDAVTQVADTLYDDWCTPSQLQTNYPTIPFSSKPPGPSGNPSNSAQVYATTVHDEKIAALSASLAQLTATVSELANIVKNSHPANPPPNTVNCCQCSAVNHSNLNTRSQSPRRSQSPYPYRRDRTQSPTRYCKFFDGKCYFHFRFGADAKKCRTGCATYDPNLIIVDEKN